MSINSDFFVKELGFGRSVNSRENLFELLKETVKEGETILICGARDNSLSVLAKTLAENL
jgi:UDP-N-acetylmuramyl pentapeptide synthase